MTLLYNHSLLHKLLSVHGFTRKPPVGTDAEVAEGRIGSGPVPFSHMSNPKTKPLVVNIFANFSIKFEISLMKLSGA
jgi:hypothetical protein